MPRGRKPKYHIFDDEWVRLYNEDNLSLSRIAAIYDCSPSTVYKRLKARGVVLRPPVTPKGIRTIKLTDETIAETIRLYKSGLTGEQIGEIMFVSPTAVYHRLHKAGVKLRKSQSYFSRHSKIEPPHSVLRQAEFLYTQGWSAADIAKLQGVHAHTVARRLQRAGIPIRSRSDAQYAQWKRRKKAST